MSKKIAHLSLDFLLKSSVHDSTLHQPASATWPPRARSGGAARGVINLMEDVMKSNKNAKSKTSGKQSRPAKPASTSVKEASHHREGSKQQAVLDLLRRPEGTTIPTIMTATGWQQHSVHGFLAGVVRKKLGLNLVSKKTAGGRLYRVAAAGPAPSQTKGRRKIRS